MMVSILALSWMGFGKHRNYFTFYSFHIHTQEISSTYMPKGFQDSD
jgi:hypothetical protein